MGSKRELSVEREMTIPELATYLEEIVSALRAGKLYVEHGGQIVSMMPADPIKLSVEAKQKHEKERLRFELSWLRRVAVTSPDVDLRISSGRGEST